MQITDPRLKALLMGNDPLERRIRARPQPVRLSAQSKTLARNGPEFRVQVKDNALLVVFQCPPVVLSVDLESLGLAVRPKS
jgi:hypothetical protein